MLSCDCKDTEQSELLHVSGSDSIITAVLLRHRQWLTVVKLSKSLLTTVILAYMTHIKLLKF